MDFYKKKSLKFNSEVRRELRYAETLKARESSRFKRLSVIRSISEDTNENICLEKPKEIACQELKKPVSRLEILRKWKHEKIVKKEIEKKNNIRPFYAGASYLNNANKVPSSSMVSRVPTKQVSSCNYVQTSRIPNSSKMPTTLTSRIQHVSKPIGSIPKTSKNTQSQERTPSSNQELTKKPTVFGNNLLKSKIQAGTSGPSSFVNGPSSAKGFQSRAGISGPASSANGSTSTKGFQSRAGTSGPSSSVNGPSSAKGFQSRLAKPASVVPRRIPVQSKLPVTNTKKPITALSKKLPSFPSVGKKLPAVPSAPGIIKKPGLISKINLKKAPHALGNQKQVKKAFPESTANRSKKPSDEEIIPEIKNGEVVSTEYKPESDSEMNIESLTDDIFECNVSIIKRASFAPENFTFQPPSEILDFSFDYSILKKIKEFTSRTSTPSKQGTKSDEDDKDVIQKPSENVHIETDIISKLGQDSKLDEDDKEIMQRSSENVKIESNIPSCPEDLVQDSENSPPKIQKPYDSSQPACHNSAVTDEEILLKTETEKNFDLYRGVDSIKYNYTTSAFQNAYMKRHSILRKSTLVSIAEAEDKLSISLSPLKDAAENKENVFLSPQNSGKFSNLIRIDESPSTTPRRSLRLQNKISKNTQQDDSINKASCHTNLTNDFDLLTLEDFDKMNPEDYLYEDDSPAEMNSKKISLLYSPCKRKSTRRSIRGDLMLFSPTTKSPRV